MGPVSIRETDIAIVGAGAAGLATAIVIGQTAVTSGRPRVLVLDGARRPGAKILVSGGSRCNVTNVEVREADFWTSGKTTVIRRILRALPVADTVAWFRDMGVTLHEEVDGKLFPDSNRARDVLEALLRTMESGGATLLADTRVEAIERAPGAHIRHDGEPHDHDADGHYPFILTTSSGPVHARAVVLATGGRALPRSGSDGAGYAMATALGHHLVQTTPALAPLTLAWDGVRPAIHQRLTGVAHPVDMAVWVDGRVDIRFSGSMLWTHFGVSGPVALNASRHVERARLHNRAVRVTIGFYPGFTFEQLDADLASTASERPKVMLQTVLAQTLPASVVTAVLHDLQIDSAQILGQLTRADRRRLAHALSEWELPVTGTRGYTYAEATAGGIDLSEIDPASMESRVCPGLFLVGEVLDVDGRLGGFNFQWAWATARVAGLALAKRWGTPA